MAIEEEFTLEISDEDADKITTVAEAVDYVSAQPEGLCVYFRFAGPPQA